MYHCYSTLHCYCHHSRSLRLKEEEEGSLSSELFCSTSVTLGESGWVTVKDVEACSLLSLSGQNINGDNVMYCKVVETYYYKK